MQNSLFVLDPQKKSLALLEQATMTTEGFHEPRDLETWLSSLGPDTQMLGRKILWVSRQDRTTDDQRSDLIGIADDGDLVVAELKRTARRLCDYASSFLRGCIRLQDT